MESTDSQGCRSSERGFSLIELLFALGVMLFGLLAYAGLTVTVQRASALNKERRLALQGAQGQLELLHTMPFDECFAAFDANPENDSAFAPGPHFDVEGLAPQPGDPDGRVGRIRFPTALPDVAAKYPALREDVDSPELGTPMDLDGDAAIDGTAKDGVYVQLPVVVEVRWTGSAGEQSIRVRTVLTPNER